MDSNEKKNKNKSLSINLKLVLMFVLIVLLSTLTVGFFAYQTAYKQIEYNFSQTIQNTAVTAALHIDGNKHSNITTEADKQSSEYQDIRAYCEKIKTELGVPYAYTLMTRNDKVYFVIATNSPPGKEYSWQSGMKEAFSGQPSSTEGFYTDEFGTFKTAYAPIKNSSGQVVGVMAIDFNAKDILAFRTKVLTNLAMPIVTIIGICFVLAIWLARKISNPIKLLHQNFQQMAEGDFTSDIDIKSKDEVGELASSLNHMKNNFKSLITGIQNYADSVASHSQELASTSEEVSATVEETASTTNEVAATAAQGTDNAEKAARESGEMLQVAEEGNRSVLETVAKINSIAEASKNVSRAVQKLGEQSTRIGEIISTITNIADQTNLLALNAAIEAARAGEHGRGFAVVAEEVRKLAEQSAGAASEITGLINEIQVGVGEAIAAMEQGSAEVEEGVQVANNAGASLEQIIKAVEKNTALIQDVASGAKQANEGTQQLTEATEQIASTVQQVSTAAQELANIATELQNMVVKFKVDEQE